MSFFSLPYKIVVAMVTEIVKIFQKHMDPEITKNYSSYLDETWYVNRWQCADYPSLVFFSLSHDVKLSWVCTVCLYPK